MLSEMLQTLDDPRMLHAAAVHWPIVLTPFALVGLMWRLFGGRKRIGAVLVSVAALLLAATGAGVAAGAGEESIAGIRTVTETFSTAESEALERHESLGEGAWMWPLGCAIVAGLTLAPKPKWLGIVATVVAILAVGFVSARFAWTGHTGGVLVYEHGLGTVDR
ncbi:MAG: hypothetical protein CMJ31_05435 [Phycisphaerae bacterium]|nr:hypothetical protein [Phycisphaerae bacterium]